MTKWQAQCARSASLCTGQPTADFPRPGVRVPQLPRGGSPPHAVLLYVRDNQRRTDRSPRRCAQAAPVKKNIADRP